MLRQIQTDTAKSAQHSSSDKNENINMIKMEENMHDSMLQEDQENDIDDEITDILPPCEECEKHIFYRESTFNVFDALFVVISLGTFVADVVTGQWWCNQIRQLLWFSYYRH